MRASRFFPFSRLVLLGCLLIVISLPLSTWLPRQFSFAAFVLLALGATMLFLYYFSEMRRSLER